MSEPDSSADESEAAMLERILTTRRAESLRQFVTDQLQLRADESVLSIGCGPGFETAALAADIGEHGCVHGVDRDREVLAAARDRCEDVPRISFVRGDATALPVADDSYDVAVAKQVYQFVPDLEAALAELYRVLEPGGRAAIVASDVDARVIHSSDRDRTRRVQAAYRDARPHPHLGARLSSALPDAGFDVETVEPTTRVQTEIDEQIERGIEVHREIAAADDSIDRSTIDAWERDLRALDADGEFFFAGTQFCYVARKPQ